MKICFSYNRRSEKIDRAIAEMMVFIITEKEKLKKIHSVMAFERLIEERVIILF